jgi:hypothetical protein
MLTRMTTCRGVLALALLVILVLPTRAQTLLDTITGFTPNRGVSNTTGAPGRNVAGGLSNSSYSVPFGYIPAQATNRPISSVQMIGYLSARDFDAGFRPTYSLSVGSQSGLFSDPASGYTRAFASSTLITERTRIQGNTWVEIAIDLTFAPLPDFVAQSGGETLAVVGASFFGQDATGLMFTTERGVTNFHTHGTIFKQNTATPSQGRYFTGSDLGDYVMMQINGASGASIPEPSSLVFTLSGFLAFWYLPKKRRVDTSC